MGPRFITWLGLYMLNVVWGSTGPGDTNHEEQLVCGVEGPLLTLTNGFVRVTMDTREGRLTSIQGSFEGNESELKDVTQQGFRLETRRGAEVLLSSEGRQEVEVVKTGICTFRVAGIVDSVESPLVREAWTLTLAPGERHFTLAIEGEVLQDASIVWIRHSLYVDQLATYGLFAKGVVQMLDAPQGQQHLATLSPLDRWYAIGGHSGNHSSTEVRLDPNSTVASIVLENTDCCDPKYKTGAVDIEQAFVTPAAAAYPYHSALHVHHFSGPHARLDAWAPPSVGDTTVTQGDKYTATFRIAPNDGDFPVYGVTTERNLPARDLRALLTGMYSAPLGSVRSFFSPGMSTPTIWRPEPSYQGNHNFFDPDCFFTLSALLHTGDAYVQEQVRLVLEETVKHLRVSDNLMPHHLTEAGPTYGAISGATQPGPNVFWTLACLNYAGATGDHVWLRKMLPTLSKVVSYLVLRVDNATGLIASDGPLMIDVFIREGLTSDTNAAAHLLFTRFAEVHELLGESGEAGKLRDLAKGITEGYNKHLWSSDGDHYVTSVDAGTRLVTKDMVDYDANLLAIASGVVPPERAMKVLARIDSGACIHGRGTWVSEKEYTIEHVYGHSQVSLGDSKTSMARIAYFDGLSRQRVGDQAGLDTKILDPIRDDLLEFLWLNERYDCQGKRSRGYGFVFYPAVVAMLMREVRYGLVLAPGAITLSPLGPIAFRYSVGNVEVDYSATRVAIRVPGSNLCEGGERIATRYTIKGVAVSTDFTITAPTTTGAHEEQRVQSTAVGVLAFVMTCVDGNATVVASTSPVNSPISDVPFTVAEAGVGSMSSAVESAVGRKDAGGAELKDGDVRAREVPYGRIVDEEHVPENRSSNFMYPLTVVGALAVLFVCLRSRRVRGSLRKLKI